MMNQFSDLGRVFVILGVVFLIVGLLMMFGSKLGIGKLPGDIAIKKGNFTLYFPIVTSIVISLGLTVILNIFFRK